MEETNGEVPGIRPYLEAALALGGILEARSELAAHSERAVDLVMDAHAAGLPPAVPQLLGKLMVEAEPSGQAAAESLASPDAPSAETTQQPVAAHEEDEERDRELEGVVESIFVQYGGELRMGTLVFRLTGNSQVDDNEFAAIVERMKHLAETGFMNMKFIGRGRYSGDKISPFQPEEDERTYANAIEAYHSRPRREVPERVVTMIREALGPPPSPGRAKQRERFSRTNRRS